VRSLHHADRLGMGWGRRWSRTTPTSTTGCNGGRCSRSRSARGDAVCYCLGESESLGPMTPGENHSDAGTGESGRCTRTSGVRRGIARRAAPRSRLLSRGRSRAQPAVEINAPRRLQVTADGGQAQIFEMTVRGGNGGQSSPRGPAFAAVPFSRARPFHQRRRRRAFRRDYAGKHLCPTFDDAVTRHRMLDAIEKPRNRSASNGRLIRREHSYRWRPFSSNPAVPTGQRTSSAARSLWSFSLLPTLYVHQRAVLATALDGASICCQTVSRTRGWDEGQGTRAQTRAPSRSLHWPVVTAPLRDPLQCTHAPGDDAKGQASMATARIGAEKRLMRRPTNHAEACTSRCYQLRRPKSALKPWCRLSSDSWTCRRRSPRWPPPCRARRSGRRRIGRPARAIAAVGRRRAGVSSLSLGRSGARVRLASVPGGSCGRTAPLRSGSVQPRGLDVVRDLNWSGDTRRGLRHRSH